MASHCHKLCSTPGSPGRVVARDRSNCRPILELFEISRRLAIWIFVLMFVALACPNTLQILSRYEPALGVKPQQTEQGIARLLEWNASLPWALAVSGIAAIAIVSISGPSEFLYWQF